MPLKPIFEKSPLTSAHALPLRPGQVQAECAAIRTLSQALTESDMARQPLLWEGLFRAGAITCRHPETLPVARWIAGALEAQDEQGALPGSALEQLAEARAALALYEFDPRRPTLERLARWCAWLAGQLDGLLDACPALRQRPADLMELLEQLYRITGKKAILALCETLRRRCMDWSGLLHTFAVQRPMSRVTPWSDMEPGLEAEDGNEQGFYTRQYLTCHGEALADGARATVMNGIYSGGGTELSAAQAGWERISRYHGAVCGGLTCDETLGGASPSAAVDAVALGAWAETFCAAGEMGKTDWDALELMLENAMAKAVSGSQLHTLQRVNGLAADCGTAGVYHLGENREARAVARLLRGYAAAYSHAVTARKRGLDVNLYLPGRYVAGLDGSVIAVTIAGGEGRYTLTLHMKQDAKAALRLRIPAWTNDACVTVNDEGGDEGKPGTFLTLERTWHDGDVITCAYARTLRMLDGHHQSRCVMLGSTLMLMEAAPDTAWAMALTGDAALDAEGRVTCAAAPVQDWRKRGAIPADLPVLPKVTGEESTITLVPYASACGIALFPKGTRA